ncbi:hypothetical protein IV500_15615 [Paeniglutamicibacter antarcticus]|uniref:Uncharacterized protein n=1 Tax=Arthrobacter terrae TaxID=2935737 RepID=A0A931G697_9MICC|nr:hypothetical protein [Arthrobacter terrae]MBG0740803.1 hypothetical protein [Arthrobacter terrae]
MIERIGESAADPPNGASGSPGPPDKGPAPFGLPGGPLPPTAFLTAPTGSYTVRGGVGSVSYVLGEIMLASASLQRIADELAPVEQAAARALNLFETSSPAWAPYPFGLIAELRSAAADCSDCRMELEAVALDARTASSRYAASENQALAQLDRGKAVHSNMSGWQLHIFGLPMAPMVIGAQLITILQDAQQRGLRDVAQDAVGHLPDYLSGVLGFPLLLPSQATTGAGRTAPLPPSGVIAASGLRHVMDSGGIFVPGGLKMERLPPAQWSPAQRPRAGPVPDHPATTDPAAIDPATTDPATTNTAVGTMAPTLHDALAGSRDAYRVAPAAIVIKRVDRGDGTAAWIADLPGTEQWWPLDGANPWDVEGDLEAITSAQRAGFAQRQVLVEEWVKAALRDAGAAAGDAVMINGHSGGGIHAAAMAANPAFLAEVNVRIINIAGAPGANQHVHPGIHVMDLENVDDIVTAADLAPPPETADWVSVTSGRRPSSSLADPGKLVANAHSLDYYLDDAAELDRSGNVSVVAHKEALQQFLGPAALTGAVSYRKYVYQGTDVNLRKRDRGQKRD